MKSLFLRIFLSFWVAQALFIVLAILVTLALRPRNPSWEALRTTALNDSVSAYEEGGDRQVRQYLMELENTQHVRAFLFNEQGEEVSRRAAPDWALRIAAGGPRMPREGFVFPAPSVLRDSRASSETSSLYAGARTASRTARFLWTAGYAGAGPDYRGRFLRAGLLFHVVVSDQADRTAACCDAATFCRRSDGTLRSAAQPTSG